MGIHTVHLFYLWIPNTTLARERIKQRVKEGGHDVPFKDVKRRFKRSQKNFMNLYQSLCDDWIVFDNSGSRPAEIVRLSKFKRKIANQELFKLWGGIKNES